MSSSRVNFSIPVLNLFVGSKSKLFSGSMNWDYNLDKIVLVVISYTFLILKLWTSHNNQVIHKTTFILKHPK